MSKGRNRIHSSVSSIASSIARFINPVNTIRMQRTLNLEGVDITLKPHINDLMPIIEERLEEEARQRNIAIARSWARSGKVLQNVLFDGADYGFEDEEEYFAYLHNQKKLRKQNKKKYGESTGSKKRGSRGSKKSRQSLNDGYSYGLVDPDDFWEHRRALYGDDFESDDNDAKHIYFYPDVEQEMDVVEFQSLSEFNEYCEKNGYEVGDTDFSNLQKWNVIHCCLDPIDLSYGEKSIVTDTSYGGLYWTVEPDLSKSKKAQ